MIEQLKTIIGNITIIVVVLLSIIAARILFRLKLLIHSKIKFFIRLICIGMISYGIAELVYLKYAEWPNPSDIFNISGDILFLIAFSYLYIKSEKKELTFKDIKMIIFTLVFTISLLVYLSYVFILPNIADVNLLEIVLDFYYPISSLILFLIVFLYQINKNEKKGFIFYIVLDAFFSYVANMIYVYNDFTENYGVLGILSDSLYLLGFLFLLLGLLLFFIRMYDNNEIMLKQI